MGATIEQSGMPSRGVLGRSPLLGRRALLVATRYKGRGRKAVVGSSPSSGRDGAVQPGNGPSSSECVGATGSQVDLARRCAWIHPDQAKARKAIAVPLTAAAVVVCVTADWQARDARIHVSGQANSAGQHQGVALGVK